MSARVRTLIIDDEPLARAGIRVLLAGDADVEIVGEVGDGPEAVGAVAELAPELLFLDVHMPELDGFGVLRQLAGGRDPVVVFVTAHDQHALRAFEAQAFDYVVKPIDEDRFAATLARAKQQVRRVRLEHAAAAVGGVNDATAEAIASHLIVRTGARTRLVPVEEIDWIEAADYCARLHIGATTHVMRESLSSLAARMDPARFIRVHRSAIVRLDQIREIRSTRSGTDEVVLRDGTCVPLGRRRRERLRNALAALA